MTGRKAKQLLWMVLKANNGFHLEKSDMEDFPGDDRAAFTFRVDLDGSMHLTANALPVSNGEG